MTDRERPDDDDLALSRLLDDALPAEETGRLRRRLADDPALARRFEALRRSDGAVRQAYAGIADEPLPGGVIDLLGSRGASLPGGAAVVPMARPVRRFGLPSVLTAAAALAAGFLIAFLLLPRVDPQGPPGLIARGGVVPPGSSLFETLQTVASSESKALGEGWTATPRLTFLNVGGEPCRRVDLSREPGGLATLACRREGSWHMELIAFDAAPGPNPDGGFRPASDGGPSRIDDAIDALIEGDPLGRDAERALISAGWQSTAE